MNGQLVIELDLERTAPENRSKIREIPSCKFNRGDVVSVRATGKVGRVEWVMPPFKRMKYWKVEVDGFRYLEGELELLDKVCEGREI